MERIEQLVIHGVTRHFGTATALHSFDLELAGGTFTTLLGPSGCGKTTLLNILAGLLDPSEGEIRLNGDPITEQPVKPLRL